MKKKYRTGKESRLGTFAPDMERVKSHAAFGRGGRNSFTDYYKETAFKRTLQRGCLRRWAGSSGLSVCVAL